MLLTEERRVAFFPEEIGFDLARPLALQMARRACPAEGFC